MGRGASAPHDPYVPFSTPSWDPSAAALANCAAGFQGETQCLVLKSHPETFRFDSLLGGEAPAVTALRRTLSWEDEKGGS